MKRNRIRMLMVLTVVGALAATTSAEEGTAMDEKVLGFINHVPEEATAAAEARKARVAERLAQDTVIMLHRGATRLAEENSIEAFKLAMDHGADGNEIDIHLSDDGVLYLHHDGLDGTYYEIVKAHPHIPTLAALFQLARERAMLFHLDIKESGIQQEIMDMITAFDLWPHIIHVNPYNSDRIMQHPKFKPVTMRGWLNEDWSPDDPALVEDWTSRPEKITFVKYDPRHAVEFLGREPGTPAPMPGNLRAWWSPDGTVEPAEGGE